MRRTRSLAWCLTVLAALAAAPLVVSLFRVWQHSRHPVPPHPRAADLPPEPTWWPLAVSAGEREDGTADVWAGIHIVVRFQAPAGSLSPGQRAELAASRLRQMMESARLGHIAAGETAAGGWGLFVEETLIAVADAETARLNDSTPRGLAEVWARNLKRALGILPEQIPPARGPLLTRCTRVVDGDTIVIEGGDRVRYIGIDTPETKHPDKPVEHLGREAAEVNRELAQGKRIRVEFDVAERDRYGRLLGYVYVQPEAVGESATEQAFVNAELVRRGYAKVYTLPPNVKHAERFLELERQARENGRGLWAELGEDDQ